MFKTQAMAMDDANLLSVSASVKLSVDFSQVSLQFNSHSELWRVPFVKDGGINKLVNSVKDLPVLTVNYGYL